jgi:hypothetical protein
MDLDGEHIDVRERLVTSPVAGTFVPLDSPPQHVEVDDVVGHVLTSDAVVVVRSAFRGWVVEVVATAGQRLRPHERVAWLRVA